MLVLNDTFSQFKIQIETNVQHVSGRLQNETIFLLLTLTCITNQNKCLAGMCECVGGIVKKSAICKSIIVTICNNCLRDSHKLLFKKRVS